MKFIEVRELQKVDYFPLTFWNHAIKTTDDQKNKTDFLSSSNALSELLLQGISG